MKRQALLRLGILVLLPVVAGVGVALWDQMGRLSFNADIWKRDSFEAFSHRKASELSAATRDRMVTDLLKRYRLAGMQRADVVKLLGEPDLANEVPFREWDMIYWLGPDARGLAGALDFMWLVLKVDSSGKVSECKVTVD